MKVREILGLKGNRVVTIRPDASVASAVHRLAAEHIGALVVSTDGRTIVGILSERDIIHGLATEGGDLLATSRRVSDLMTTGVVTCAPEANVKTIMAEMTRRRIRHIPVVEGHELAGMVSIGDLIHSRLDEVELEANVLRDAYLGMH